MKERTKGILVTLVVGAGIAAAVMALNWSRDVGFLQKLCDGLFVAAVMLLGSGGLKFFRNQGVFDMMSFGIAQTYYTMFPSAKMNLPEERQKEDLYEYQQRKRKERKSPAELLIAGAVFLALSLIAFGLYKLNQG